MIRSRAVPLVATGADEEREPALSRDGKWLAYTSIERENGSADVFVRPFLERRWRAMADLD